ncbi:MAG: hypothetical protein ABIK83_14705 [Candidatus Zixiibacteriota bacterium]
MGEVDMSRSVYVSLIILTAVLLSLFTVWAQVSPMGRDYIETEQLKRHRAVMEGHAGNPWQYRVFAEYIVEESIDAARALGLDRPISNSLVAVRVVQNMLIFLMAYLYYRKLGLKFLPALVGISILGWGMTYALYDSDMQFNTYFDVIFYLLAGLAILYRKYAWVILITFLAALNRESSGFIPILLLAVYWVHRDEEGSSKILFSGIAALAAYTVVFFGMRQLYSPQEVVSVYGLSHGLEVFKYNVFRVPTWIYLFGTLGIIPILAVLSLRQWPQTLRAFFWTLVPAWFVLHMFISIMAETRIFLVPQALILVPGAMIGATSLVRSGSHNY